MNTGTVQIMWKEIIIGLVILYCLRIILDIYMIKTYKKLIAVYEVIPMDEFKLKAQRHVKLCNIFSVGPWNQRIYTVYNGLCWLLASESLMENNENDFLYWLAKIKKEKEFEMKVFALSLYYRSKNQYDAAMYFYNEYLKCRHINQDIAVIMHKIFHKDECIPESTLNETVKNFKNKALIKLLKDNGIA